jgi:DNA-binding CsgD family transcriptional regulator
MSKAITAVMLTTMAPARLLTIGNANRWPLERTQPIVNEGQASPDILSMIGKEGETMIATLLTAQAALWLLHLLIAGGAAPGNETDLPMPARLPSLTQRENEVLHLLADGHSNAQIGRYLCISENTVRAHVYSFYNKLNVNSRVQAARLVLI